MTDGIVAGVEFRTLPEFPGYRFGSDGSVWSKWVQRIDDGETATKSRGELGDVWKVRRPTINPASGYCQMQLKTNASGKLKYKTCRIHVLILRAFKGERPAGMQACHNDGNKLNCRADNLRWDTGKANQNDRRKHGTHIAGEQHYRAKLTSSAVTEIRKRAASGADTKALAREFGVKAGAVDSVVHGRTWRHIA